MTRSLLPHLFLLLVALAGCDTEDSPPVADTGGEISFLLDGQEWAVAANLGASVQSYGYFLSASWPSPENPKLTQTLLITLPSISEQTYPAAESQASGRLYGLAIVESDDDAILSSHVATDAASETGGFTVTHYDEATGEIEATFEGTFSYRGGNEAIRTLPNTFRVTEGRLRVTLAN